MSSKTKKGKHAKSLVPSDWSEWALNNEQTHYVRYRSGVDGEYEYEYWENTAEAGTTEAQLPSPSDTRTPTYPGQPRYVPETNVTQSDPSQAELATSPGGYGFGDLAAGVDSLSLGKGKGQEPEYTEPSQGVYKEYGQTPALGANDQSALDAAAFNAGRQQSLYATSNVGESSSMQGSQHQSSNLISSPTPVSVGEEEPLDKNFKVHHADKFGVGKVFKILWSEPTGVGQNGTVITAESAVVSRSKKHQEPFYHKIRRFVVVKHFHGHCLCLPIVTYQRRGLAKKGIQPQDHAIIYGHKDKPTHEHSEYLVKKPVMVKLEGPREKLLPESLLNYAKVYTIEYNVKVQMIGRVPREHQHQLIVDYHNTQGLGSASAQQQTWPGYNDSSIAEETSNVGGAFQQQ